MGKRRIKSAGKKPPVIRTVRALNCGSRMRCIDNSGAKIVEIVAVKGYRGIRGRSPNATIGDLVLVAVKDGSPELRKKMVKAVITSQSKEFQRPSGLRVKFEENSCVVVDDEGNPKGTEIKSPVAKEAIERWAGLGKIASIVV